MSMFSDLTLAPTLQALALSLLHGLWQGLFAAGLLWAARFSLRSAGAKYVAGCSALFGMVLAWGATFVLLLQGDPAGTNGVGAIAPPQPLLAVFLGAWFIGVLACAAHSLGGWLRLRAWVDESRPSQLQGLLDQLRQCTGTKQAVRLLESTRHGAPIVVGWLKPVILAPPAVLMGLSQEHLEAILRHELAHVRRHDYVVNLLQTAIETVFFYNPFTHWISARIRMEREICCDAEAAKAGRGRLAHAKALTALEQLRLSSPALAPSAQGGSLMVRIQVLLQSDEARSPGLAARAAFPSLVALLLLGVSLSAMAARQLDDAQIPEKVRRYSADLEEAGIRHDVDPRLLAVMMIAESGGNPEAVSPTGAQGLMQVMPATARRIAKERGLPSPSETELRDPETNLDYAAWYLSKQLRRFETDGDEREGRRRAVAAYNAGPDRVSAWLAGTRDLPNETRRYERFVSEQMDQRETEALGQWFAAGPHTKGAVKMSEPTSRRAAVHPLDGARLTSTFGEKKDPISLRARFHTGIDLAAKTGTPVLAAFGGVVLSAKDEGARGNSVVIQQIGTTQTTRYDHLEGFKVEAGQVLSAGEVLGTVGSTGRSTGPHLHFEVHENGEAIDPATVLP